MKQPWFSNKGQIIQIGLQVLTILIGLKLWPEMSANHMLTGGAFLFYFLMGMAVLATVVNVVFTRKSSGKIESSPAIPPPILSPADQSLLNRARSELDALTFQRRVALRLVYHSPGQFAGAYVRQLETLGFPDGEQIVKPLMGSMVLTYSSPQMHLSQSPHGFIQQLVEEEMAKPSWAGI
jgi:hypothetical protein